MELTSQSKVVYTTLDLLPSVECLFADDACTRPVLCSQAVQIDNVLYMAGQVGMDPKVKWLSHVRAS